MDGHDGVKSDTANSAGPEPCAPSATFDCFSVVESELKTPLTAIRSAAEILRDNGDLSVGERNRLLDIVIADGRRLNRLINELLYASEVQAEPCRLLIDAGDLRSRVRKQAL